MNIITLPKYNNKIKGKKCTVCGEDAFAHISGVPYCRRHYLQMKRGGIKERTTRDPNELIDLGASIKIVLYNKSGQKLEDFGLIDDEDSKLVQGKKVGFGKFGDKKYCYVSEKGKITLLHRYVWEKHNGQIQSGKVVDHINGNGLDCRKENLRLASALENSYNLSKPNKYTGVNPNGDRFNARIMYGRKDFNLGTFPTLKEALDARINAERRYFGDFGPNVSRYDRGLINYSQNYNYSNETPSQNWYGNFNPYNYINYHAHPEFSNIMKETAAGKDYQTGGFKTLGWVPRAMESVPNWLWRDEYYKNRTRGSILNSFILRTGRMPTQSEWNNLSGHNLGKGDWRSIGREAAAYDGLELAAQVGSVAIPGSIVVGGATKVLNIATKGSLLKKLASLSNTLKSGGIVGKATLGAGKVAGYLGSEAIDVKAIDRISEMIKKTPDEEINEMLKQLTPEQIIMAGYQHYSQDFNPYNSEKLRELLYNNEDDGDNILRLASSSENDFEKLKSQKTLNHSDLLGKNLSQFITNPMSKGLRAKNSVAFRNDAIRKFLGEEPIEDSYSPNGVSINNELTRRARVNQDERLLKIPGYKELAAQYNLLSDKDKNLYEHILTGNFGDSFVNAYKDGRTEYGYDKSGNVVSRTWNETPWYKPWASSRGEWVATDLSKIEDHGELASARFQLGYAKDNKKSITGEDLSEDVLKNIDNNSTTYGNNRYVDMKASEKPKELTKEQSEFVKNGSDFLKNSGGVEKEQKEKVSSAQESIIPSITEKDQSQWALPAAGLGALALGGLALYNSNKKKKKKQEDEETEDE